MEETVVHRPASGQCTAPTPSLNRIKDMAESTREEDVRAWEEFLEQQKQQYRQRMDRLTGLYQEPASAKLQAYLERLKRGPDKRDSNGAPIWDGGTLVKGIKRFAELLGCQRSDYYDNPLKGLHYPHTFLEQWARSYPELPTPLWLDDFRWQCPPDWSNRVMGVRNAWVLYYDGTEPLSQALNRLILGPTTLDCGMCSTLALWFGLRYALGDEWFNKVFTFEKSLFILTQKWHLRMSKDLTVGNLLYDFYDLYADETFGTTSEMHTSFQMRTVHNHESYLHKHPGGAGRLQNIIQFSAEECVVFDPLGSSLMSLEELDRSLLKAFNSEQSPADIEEVELFKTNPEFIDPRRGSKSYGELAEAAGALANRMLSRAEWDESVYERTERARNLRFIFNIERLIECVTNAIDVGFGDNVEGEIFRQARNKKQNKSIQLILSLSKRKS